MTRRPPVPPYTEPCRSVQISGPCPAAAPSVIGMRALAAALAVLVCGGCTAAADQWVPPPDDPAPAATAASGGPGTAPDQTEPASRAETVRIGAELQVRVERPTTSNPGQIGMFTAIEEFYTGSWRAVVTRGRDLSYLADLEVDVGRKSYEWVREFLDEKASVRGTARLYGLTVSAVSGAGAQVDVCVDESGLRLVDAATGRPVTRQPAWTRPPQSAYQYIAAVRKEDDGTWRIRALQHAVHPHERARACRRALPDAALPDQDVRDQDVPSERAGE